MARKPGKIVDKMLATDIDDYALVYSVKIIAASRIFEIRNTFWRASRVSRADEPVDIWWDFCVPAVDRVFSY